VGLPKMLKDDTGSLAQLWDSLGPHLCCSPRHVLAFRLGSPCTHVHEAIPVCNTIHSHRHVLAINGRHYACRHIPTMLTYCSRPPRGRVVV
jgi:hypothetical protein